MKQKIQIRLKEKLWNAYSNSIPELPLIFKNVLPVIDHYAIIDLPSKHSGIGYWKSIFEICGLEQRGSGYLAKKQNDFIWIADPLIEHASILESTPQVVLADFRMEELSKKTQQIIQKYSNYIDSKFDIDYLYKLENEPSAVDVIADEIANHVNLRPWPQPTLNEYLSVNEENPLLAWVLLFGRKVNHFGIGVHAMGNYKTFSEFNKDIQDNYQIKLNDIDGIIKGSPSCGIEQSSTIGALTSIRFNDKVIQINDSFLEFAWRHAIVPNPKKMGDYYLDFLPDNADKVIESLYTPLT